MPLTIAAAQAAGEIELVRTLLLEYWDSFGFPPSFQNFSLEVAGLPGLYAPPEGRLGLALLDGQAAGCVALRRIDPLRCEAKRLYVRGAFRGRGLGGELLRWVIAEARAAGYAQVLGDTMPAMREALGMYERWGFQRVAAYSDKPTPGAIYLCLNLKDVKS
jgi:GNAT superfamily N-acetyltransferase